LILPFKKRVHQESNARIFNILHRLFYEGNNWYIVDGDGEKESLNGTWLLVDEYMDIYEGMIVRAGTTSFKANFSYP
jgi:hypothetical protein